MSSAHRIKAFLKHLRKAKSRHGVHSPFVFEFIENGLKKNPAASKLMLVTSRHKRLVNKAVSYFKCQHILWLTNREGEKETFITAHPSAHNQLQLRSERFDFNRYDDYPSPDILLFDLPHPSDWLKAWEKYEMHIKPSTIILIISIHHTKEHSSAWEELYSFEKVRLSLDLYKIGLLFFGEEFKEKQHFMLKAGS